MQRVLTKRKQKNTGDFAWDRLPADLKPNWKRKKDAAAAGGLVKRQKFVDVEEKLKVLEEKEKDRVMAGVDKEATVKAESDDEDQVNCREKVKEIDTKL